MRGLAALAVAIFHFDNDFVPAGYLAVDFFFVLSGFVLDHTYRARFAAGLGTGEFMARRFIRLWPMHLCGLALCFGWLAQLVARDATDIGWGTLLSGLGANMLFLPSVTGRDIAPINPPAWSLLMEFGANWLMACFAIRRSTRALVALVGMMALVLVGDLAVTQAFTPFDSGASVVKMGYRWHDVHLGMVRTIFSFLCGMVLSRLLGSRPHRVSRRALLALCVVPLLLLAPLMGWARFGYDLGFILLASPALVWAGARLEVPEGWRGFGEWLGDLSYPLYAVHYFWTYPVILVGYSQGWPVGLSLTVFLVMVVACALFCAKYVDFPLRKALGSVLMGILVRK
ncbi:MAG: acyltransferase [Sphingomonadales bacterium]|nr:acyltransferase [Sphingomonadales bacterium]MDE2169076.1 acyltransferase [Sphingomonadales bacterium]